MKVTRSRLLQIIREEVQAITNMPAEEEEQVEVELAPDTRSNRNAKIVFKRDFLAQHPDFKEMSPRAEGDREVRVGPQEAGRIVNEADIVNMFDNMGYTIEQEILPGQPGSKTSKYKTWLLSKDGGPSFSVVFGSANKGEKFEAALHADLVAGEGPLGDEILGALSMTRDQVLSVDPPLPARKRPLTREISNAGKEISDITLNVKPSKKNPEGKIYISLKDPNGGTFANNGVAGMFVDSDGGFAPATHDLDAFVIALGIDKQRVAAGASDYKMMRDTPPELCGVEEVKPEAFDAQTISDYLASGLGYGYVYARKMNTGGYHIEDLETADDARILVGSPTSVSIIYARYCGDKKTQRSKGTRVIVDTDNGARYEVAIRNKSGKIIPNQMTISIKRYPTTSINEIRLRRALQASIRY